MTTMRNSKHSWIWIALLALLAAAVGCTSNDIDDADGPNVVLELQTLDSPPVTGATAVGTCSVSSSDCLSINDCPPGEVCNLPLGGQGCQVEEWTATFANLPKSEGAVEEPFNNIEMRQVVVSYTWSNPAFNSTIVLPLSGTIPANGTNTVTFFPITAEDLQAWGTFVGPGVASTAFLGLEFQGELEDGSGVSVISGEQLFIEACF
jgi:hypothetical protein